MKLIAIYMVTSVLVLGCSKDTHDKETATSSLEELQSKLSLTETELASLRSEHESCLAQVKELSQTDQALYEKLVGLLDDGNIEAANDAVAILEQKFPRSPLLSLAKENVTDKRLDAIKNSLSITDKGTYTRAQADLKSIQKQGTSNRQVNALLNDVNSKLSRWPLVITTIKELKIRRADLKGQAVAVPSLKCEASKYYNFSFGDEDSWRSINCEDKNDYTINAYCRRGNRDCENWFNASISSPIVTKEVKLMYPSSSRDEGVIELLDMKY